MKKRIVLIPLLSILISAISWITNFGFFRLICTLLLLPVLHVAVVLADSVLLSPFTENKKMRLYNYLFCTTYVLSNVFLPDSNELNRYMFFGLIRNWSMCTIGQDISILFFILHVILIILQVIEVIRIKTK